MPFERATRRRGRRRPFRKLVRRIRNALVGSVGPPLLSAWVGTLRVRYLGVSEREGRLPRRPSGIFVFWHQRLFAFAGLFRHAGFQAVVSRHGDGEMLARVLRRLGIGAIRGSTARGGSRAILEIIKSFDPRSTYLAITPDGPRGPRFSFRDGAVYIASRTGLPLYPVAVSYRRSLSLPTWDGFIVPCPFTKTLVRLGTGIEVPRDLDRDGLEAYRLQAEAELRALTEATDRDFEELCRTAKAWHELEEREPVRAA